MASLASAQELLWKQDGIAPSDDFGWSVSAAGDVDGDGSTDVIVGSPSDDSAGASTGAAFVYSGATGLVLHSFHGTLVGDFLGYGVDGGFDADGDHHADLVVGSRFNGAYVFSGADGHEMFHFTGNAATQFGTVVAGLGDVDGDGSDDVAVGAPFDDSVATDAGRVTVYSGKDGSLIHTLDGTATLDWFGHSIARCGDLDHDGRPDLLIGAPSQGSSGFAAVHSGATGAELFRRSESGDPGTSVSPAGDWDGDGFDDVVVGNPGVHLHGTDSGKASVVSGKDGSLLAQFDGRRDFAFFGSAVSSGFDVDDDGHPDLLVGAYNDFEIVTVRVGSAQLFSGRTGLLLYTFYGDEQDEKFGHDVALIQDADGDAMADLAVGAYRDPVSGSPAGSVRTFAGNDFYLQRENAVVREGNVVRLFLRDGAAGGMYALFLTEVDSVPFGGAIDLGVLDGIGGATFSATVPRGFDAHELVFTAFACGDPKKGHGVEDSWTETVFTVR